METREANAGEKRCETCGHWNRYPQLAGQIRSPHGHRPCAKTGGLKTTEATDLSDAADVPAVIELVHTVSIFATPPAFCCTLWQPQEDEPAKGASQ